MNVSADLARPGPLAGLLFSLALAACSALPGAGPAKSEPPPVNLSGYPPAFRHGFNDGCASAKSYSERKDATRFKSDELYAQGWRDGKDICAKR